MNPYENAKRQLQDISQYFEEAQDLLRFLEFPEKLHIVSIPLKKDDGGIETYIGYRSQHSSALGPYKGGIRYHEQVSEEEVKALSMWMSWKCSLAGIPLGGGKGGIIVDPNKLSEGELERLSRGFIQKIWQNIGPEQDIPAPDVNTDGKIMNWMRDEYEKLSGSKALGVITGKPVEEGGSLGRDAATGRGGLMVLDYFMEKFSKKPKDTKVAIQGFGNVGMWFARLASQKGYKVIAVSDSKGVAYDENGLSIDEVEKRKSETGSVNNIEMTPGDELYIDCDVLVPSALENSITDKNADKIKAEVILELANGPVTPEAEEKLAKKKIIPDILANSGGVIVSYFEWYQNQNNEKWEEDKVNLELKKYLDKSSNDVLQKSEEKGVAYRKAAYIVAVGRVIKALKNEQ